MKTALNRLQELVSNFGDNDDSFALSTIRAVLEESTNSSHNSAMVQCPQFMRNRNCILWDLAWVCGNKPCCLSQHQ